MYGGEIITHLCVCNQALFDINLIYSSDPPAGPTLEKTGFDGNRVFVFVYFMLGLWAEGREEGKCSQGAEY